LTLNLLVEDGALPNFVWIKFQDIHASKNGRVDSDFFLFSLSFVWMPWRVVVSAHASVDVSSCQQGPSFIPHCTWLRTWFAW